LSSLVEFRTPSIFLDATSWREIESSKSEQHTYLYYTGIHHPMHSFAPSLSFLLSFFLLPLLHWPQIGVRLATFDGPNNSQPPAVNYGGLGLRLARAAEIHHATKFESESESSILQDNASSSLAQPSRDGAATRHSGAVKQVKKIGSRTRRRHGCQHDWRRSFAFNSSLSSPQTRSCV